MKRIIRFLRRFQAGKYFYSILCEDGFFVIVDIDNLEGWEHLHSGRECFLAGSMNHYAVVVKDSQ